MKVGEYELSTVMKVTREEFEKWPAVITRQSNMLAQSEVPPPFEVREIKGMEGTGEPFIAIIFPGIMELAGTALGLDKTELDERYAAVLSPALQMRNAYRTIRETIADHRAALANRSIVKKSLGRIPPNGADRQSAAEQYEWFFRSGAQCDSRSARRHESIQDQHRLPDRPRTAIRKGMRTLRGGVAEIVAYLRKLRPYWLDVDDQFKKLRFGAWTAALCSISG